MTLQKRKLGSTGLELTELGFGGGAIGGLYRAVPRDAAFEAMEAAWTSGMRYFDTAPFYGFGLSERRVGDFLREKPDTEYVLSTKVGKLLTPVAHNQVPDQGFVDPLPFDVSFDYSYDGIMRSVEMSFARLGLNRIDILYVHDLEIPTLGTEAYRRHLTMFLDGGIKALNELKASGTIKAFGLGVNDVQVCLDVLQRADLDCILLAGRYTLLDRSASARLIGLCEEKNTSLIIGGVFNSGILATGAVEGSYFNYEPPTDDIIDRVNRMQSVAQENGTTLAAAALQFPLQMPLVSSILIGSAKASSLTRNVDLLEDVIPAQAWPLFDPIALV